MLRIPAKVIRASVIADYVRDAGYRGVVCFSCGNASRALRDAGLDVIDVSPGGDLTANRWWTPADIRRVWPERFDATSGHLPLHLMTAVASALRAHVGDLSSGPHRVPTGSGETITCLRLAYPEHQFIAVYGDDAATRYDQRAPLNPVVCAMGASAGIRNGGISA